ncbi:alternative ribosome rescue aminoacyl-tRNA hydrolase ArfB [Alteraurantiacibacter aquimixticola]|uniref:Aminoacyl-tRNA hydrolase n=1 Tax=Alteraurantiacibacter aquimixticola TaxID=2489173 RepID=A0A4T3F2U1_9SPHN|nr:alternative ribosome rescue aminoacyl-tRNA hydrolase ArfB [Alteraurantiacibacter aquimixticola]TIX48930.1 aminoacyl-tRNA hydrolase [Alteraurantiacibacter aquimixticola]
MGAILDRAMAQAEESFIAASGPGGQNVNKVATAVQLRVNIYALGLPPQIFHRLKELAGSRLNNAGDIVIDARNHRTQEANRREARERLTALIDEACKPPKQRKKVRVNRVGKVKRLQHKKEHSQKKANRGKVEW